MRNISQTALSVLSQAQGVESINFVDIDWIGGGQYLRYADQAFDGMNPSILSISNLENIVNISGNTTSQSITLVLNDMAGDLKYIIDRWDINKKHVKVYQWFKGIPVTDAFVIFEGEIATPITWSEGQRTLQFEVISKLEDKEVGFSPEEAQFDYIPPSLIGKAWPLVFGLVARVPSIRVNDVPSGATTDPLIIDQTNFLGEPQGRVVKNNIAAYNLARTQALACWYAALSAINTADYYRREQQSDLIFIPAEWGVTPRDFTSQIEYFDSLADQLTKRGNEYIRQAGEISLSMFEVINPGIDTSQYANSGSKVVNAKSFPQGTTIRVRVGGNNTAGTNGNVNQQNGGYFEGVFDGSQFHVITRVTNVDANQFVSAGILNVTDKPVSTLYDHNVNIQSIFVAQPGSTMTLSSTGIYNIIYVACLNWCNVVKVWAYRNFNGNRMMMPVPGSYYQVVYEDYGGGVRATIIRAYRPLSSYDEGWEDEIFCDLQSPVGPNMADIMIWIIQNYTKHTYDPHTFNHFRVLQQPYPADFALLERKNVIELLEDMAFQCRSAIWYNNGVFYVRYLSEEPAPVTNIFDDDIESTTLEMSATPTEEIVTKLNATWHPDMEIAPYRIIFRHNIAKYGTQQEDYEWFIYNRQSLVEKSLQFWMIRKSNSWKKIKFSTFLHKLFLETYDMINIHLTGDPVATGPIIGMVESVQYDSDNQRLDVTAWIPVRWGEMTKYPFAMPHDISETLIFPTIEDSAGTGSVAETARGSLYDQAAAVGPTGALNGTRPNYSHASNYNYHGRPTFQPGPNPDPYGVNDNYAWLGVPNTDRFDTTPGTNPYFYLDPGQINSPINLGEPTTTNHKQWNMKKFVPPPHPKDVATAYPGYIKSHNQGRSYKVEIYKSGTSGGFTEVNAICLAHRLDDFIPEGYPVTVMKNVWYEGQTQKVEYTFAAPIWMGDNQEYASP